MDEINKKNLPKAEQQQMIQDYLKNSLAIKIDQITGKQSAAIDEAIKIALETFKNALPKVHESAVQEAAIEQVIKDAAETFFGHGYTVTDIKSALKEIGMPPELHSTNEGQEFLKKFRAGDFRSGDKLDMDTMSSKQQKLFKKLMTWKMTSKTVLNVYSKNVFYNVFPERYADAKKREELKEKSSGKLIEEAKLYDTLVKEGFEKSLIAHWKEPLSKLGTDGAKKDSIKRQINLYNEMPYSGKLSFLTKFKTLIEEDYNSFIKMKIEERMLNVWKCSITANSPNKDRLQIQITEYKAKSVYLKWKTLKLYATAQNIGSTEDFNKIIDNFDIKIATKHSTNTKKEQSRMKRSLIETQKEIKLKAEQARKVRRRRLV